MSYSLQTTTLLLLLFIVSTTNSTTITIDLTKCVNQVDPRFLSVALDSHIVAEAWKNFDFQSERVLNMAKGGIIYSISDTAFSDVTK